MGVFHQLGEAVPLTSPQEIAQKRMTLDNAAIYAIHAPRIEFPSPKMAVEIFTEYMGNMGNPYLGTLGKFEKITDFQPDNIEFVDQKFTGNPTDNMVLGSVYLGSSVVGTGVNYG